jgi:hypothetical protein
MRAVATHRGRPIGSPPRRPARAGSRRASTVVAATGAEFDAHRWLERYRASHDRADPSDPLAGVPFN